MRTYTTLLFLFLLPLISWGQCANDTVAPVANCQNITVYLDATGVAVVSAYDINNLSTDNCWIQDYRINGLPHEVYTCADIGMFTGVLTVTDSSGNSSTCTATVQVLDNLDPRAQCKDITVSLDATGVAIVHPFLLDSFSTDNCGLQSYLINGKSVDTFDCTDVGGPNPGLLTVVDQSNNMDVCLSTITVVDEVPPTIQCPGTVVNIPVNASGIVTVDPRDIAIASDSCGIFSWRINNVPNLFFDCSNIETPNLVTIKVTDISGNTADCNAIVNIQDTLAPTVLCNGVSINLTAVNQVVLTTGGGPNSVATIQDNCSIDSIFINKDTISCADIGKLVFTVTAVDKSGNQGTCQDTAFVFVETPIIANYQQDTIAFCAGDSVHLMAIIPPNGISYASNWTGPNGSLTTDPTQTDTLLSNLSQQDEGAYIFTISTATGCPASDTVYVEIADTCIVTYSISGNVYEDLNLNCVKEGTDEALANVIIKIKGDSTYYTTTDSFGNYQAILPFDVYEVVPIVPSIYWGLCGTAQTVSFNSNHHPSVNFGLQKLIHCPLLEVDIAAPFLRKTNSGSSYVVSYCNKGTAPVFNASVVVEIDPSLNVLNTGLPIVSQVGNFYTFNINTVAVNDCGSFTIDVVVDYAAINGQTHCSEVHAYPDSICIPNYWNGPILEPTASCVGDSVLFKIRNVGTSALLAQNYTIFEDHIIMLVGNTGNIDPGDSITIGVWADTGRTYRITIPQEAGFPALLGDSIATAAIEGCRPYDDGTFNIGHITSFSNGNRSPFIAVDCQKNIASFDPNDKLAQPEGYQSAHYIYNHTMLAYKIRFQNIGTDTAFSVILRDTLSPYLDPSTIVIGASSHPFTWRLYDQNILEIRYDNIELPDSLINEPASHGFLRYNIQQKTNNPIGTVIYNTADIYFDFNPPILTNQTWHTVGENFATINVDKIENKAITVLVYPNPFSAMTTFEIKGETYNDLALTVVDLTGRIVARKETNSSSKLSLSKGNLPSGVYFYQLHGDQQLINTGKIIIR